MGCWCGFCVGLCGFFFYFSVQGTYPSHEKSAEKSKLISPPRKENAVLKGLSTAGRLQLMGGGGIASLNAEGIVFGRP